jgi:ABC-type transporter Mla MlaB component
MIFDHRPGLYLEPGGRPVLAGSDHSREPSTIRVVLEGPMGPSDVAALCENVRVSVDRRGAALVICDLGALTDADLGTLEALARLQLTSQRLGCRMGVRNAPARLRDLLLLAGLGRIVRLSVELGRQAEEWEEPLGVQEKGDTADPTT